MSPRPARETVAAVSAASPHHTPGDTLRDEAIRAKVATVIPMLPVPVIPAVAAAIFPTVVDSTRRPSRHERYCGSPGRRLTHLSAEFSRFCDISLESKRFPYYGYSPAQMREPSLCSPTVPARRFSGSFHFGPPIVCQFASTAAWHCSGCSVSRVTIRIARGNQLSSRATAPHHGCRGGRRRYRDGHLRWRGARGVQLLDTAPVPRRSSSGWPQSSAPSRRYWRFTRPDNLRTTALPVAVSSRDMTDAAIIAVSVLLVGITTASMFLGLRRSS